MRSRKNSDCLGQSDKYQDYTKRANRQFWAKRIFIFELSWILMKNKLRKNEDFFKIKSERESKIENMPEDKTIQKASKRAILIVFKWFCIDINSIEDLVDLQQIKQSQEDSMFLFNSCQKREKELSKDFDLIDEESIIKTIKNNLLLSSAKSEKISLKKKEKHQQVLFVSRVSNYTKPPTSPSARIVHPSQPNSNFFRKSQPQTEKIIRHRSPQILPCVRFSYSDRKNEPVLLKKIVEEKPEKLENKEECLFSFMQMEKDGNYLSVKNEIERGNSMLMKTNTTICQSQYIADSLSEEEREEEEITIFSNLNMKRTESIKVAEEEQSSILENFDKESFIIRFSQPLVRKKQTGSEIN